MPYKSQNLKIAGTSHDRRRRLTDKQKDEINALKGSISVSRCAKLYEVSKRTIQFLWYPERLERNKQLRQERGGFRQYYDKIKHREYIKEHRRYKHELYKKQELNETA